MVGPTFGRCSDALDGLSTTAWIDIRVLGIVEIDLGGDVDKAQMDSRLLWVVEMERMMVSLLADLTLAQVGATGCGVIAKATDATLLFLDKGRSLFGGISLVDLAVDERMPAIVAQALSCT